MANSELDPLFLKGLKLLHSRSKDSTEQLRLLWQEAINQSKHVSASKEKYSSPPVLEHEVRTSHKKTNSREYGEGSTKQSYEEVRKREVEKRPLEKMVDDDMDLLHEAKIPKLESPQVMSCYPPSPDLPKLDHFISKRADDDTDCSDDNADAGDFAMEMGLACVICKQIEVAIGNQLVECQECHSLYHQECHRPPVTDFDVNDPRRVWYCAKCMKNMKKMASKTQKPPKPVSTTVMKESSLQTRFTKPEPSQLSTVLPFKRTEVKAPVTQSSNQNLANKPTGLAGLAANFSGRVTTAPSMSSSSSLRSVNTKPLTNATKAFSNLSTLGLSSASKTVNTSTSLLSLTPSKLVNVNAYNLPSSPSTVAPSKLASSAVNSKAAGSISSPASSSSRSSSSSSSNCSSRSSSSSSTGSSSRSSSSSSTSSTSNNGGAKPATCSLLMSADKRVQIMKKRAAKMQEKRRLSTK